MQLPALYRNKLSFKIDKMQALQKPRALFPIFLFCFLSLLAAPLSADIIYLKNGKQIRGKFHGALDGL